MKKIILFFQESFAEQKKVTWPGRDEVISSTKVVLLSTVAIAAVLGLVDFILVKLVDFIFK
jgi:preprotein translocase subunit SecE